MKFLWPESWRGSLYMYLLSFPRFWTLSIERFWFLFWSILNGVTLKTSNNYKFIFTIGSFRCIYSHFRGLKFEISPRSMPPDPLVCSRLRVRISHPLPPPPLESPLRGPCILKKRSQRCAVKVRARSPSQTIIMLRSPGTVKKSF